MKKILLIIFILFSITSFAQNIQTSSLTKLNKYLKTFGNGFSGQFDVADGYIYNYHSGHNSIIKYKAKVTHLGDAEIWETNAKIVVQCIDGGDCINLVKSNTNSSLIIFSQIGSFNTEELATLWNNFIADARIYTGPSVLAQINPIQTNTTAGLTSSNSVSYTTKTNNVKDDKIEMLDADKFEKTYGKYKTADLPEPTNLTNKQKAILALNIYLSKFEDGKYGHVEVSENKFYLSKDQYYSIPITELKFAQVDIPNRSISLYCLSKTDCVCYLGTKIYQNKITFSSTIDFDNNELKKYIKI